MYQALNCPWQGCQSVLAKHKCSHKDLMSCSEWIVTEHFLSRQFMHAFKYVTLHNNLVAQEGIPCSTSFSCAHFCLTFSLETGTGG